MSRDDWIKVGQKSGWKIPNEVFDAEDVPNDPVKLELRRQSDDEWALYLGGRYLGVLELAEEMLDEDSILGDLAEDIQDAEGRVRLSA